MVGKKASSGHHHLASRVKKIMQKDEDVGKIAQATPVLICRAMELLLKKICEKTFEVATSRQAKTVNASHVKSCVMSEETLDFLKDTVAAAPDLAPEEAQAAKAASKRRRNTTAADDSEDQAGSPTGDKPKRRAAGGGRQKKEQKQQEEGEGDAAAPAPAKRRSRKKAQPDDAKNTVGAEADAQEDAAAAATGSLQQILPDNLPADDVGVEAAADKQQGMDGEPEGACTGPGLALPSAASFVSSKEDAAGAEGDGTHAAGAAADPADAGQFIPHPAMPATAQLAAAVEDDYDDDYDDDA